MPTSQPKTLRCDSSVILDTEGAERLKNPGRCLIRYCGELKEVQALYIEGDNSPTIRQFLNQYKNKI